MGDLDKNIYLLVLRRQSVCNSQKYIGFYNDKYPVRRIEFDDEEQLVDEALKLLKEGKSVIIAADISLENIERILSKTDPRKQFAAFNTIKSHQ